MRFVVRRGAGIHSLFSHPMAMLDPFAMFGAPMSSTFRSPGLDTSQFRVSSVDSEAAPTQQFSSRSFSYYSEVGSDGKERVMKSRRIVVGSGDVNQELHETFDGQKTERSLIRRIGDRSVVNRSVAGADGAPLSKTEVHGLKGDDALSKFEQEWTANAAGLPRINVEAEGAMRQLSGVSEEAQAAESEDAAREDLQGDGVRNVHIDTGDSNSSAADAADARASSSASQSRAGASSGAKSKGGGKPSATADAGGQDYVGS